jgi:hypothetical protein
MAHAVNQGAGSRGASKADLQALLRALNGMRVHIKALINANIASWHDRNEKVNY